MADARLLKMSRALSRVAVLALAVAFYGPLPTGARTMPSTLNEAAVTGDLDGIRFLLERGADVNAKTKYTGWTPLHAAIIPKLTPGLIKPTVELLISRGANLEGKDNDGRTPLHVAASDS